MCESRGLRLLWDIAGVCGRRPKVPGKVLVEDAAGEQRLAGAGDTRVLW